MTSRPPVRLCGVDELAVGDARRFVVDKVELCLVRCEDSYRAIADTCSHEDFSLADGTVDPAACEIECGLHGSLFSLESGQPLTLPATRAVAVYDVSIVGADVVVTLP